MTLDIELLNEQPDKLRLAQLLNDLARQENETYQKLIISSFEQNNLIIIKNLSEYLFFYFQNQLLTHNSLMAIFQNMVCLDQFQKPHIQIFLTVARQLTILDLKPSRYIQQLLNDQFLYLNLLQKTGKYLQSNNDFNALELILLLDANLQVPQPYLQIQQNTYNENVQTAYKILKNKQEPENLAVSQLLKKFAIDKKEQDVFGLILNLNAHFYIQKDKSAVPSKSTPEILKQIIDSNLPAFYKLLILNQLANFPDYREQHTFQKIIEQLEPVNQIRSLTEKILQARISQKLLSTIVYETNNGQTDENIQKCVDGCQLVAREPNIPAMVLLINQLSSYLLSQLSRSQTLNIKDKISSVAEEARKLIKRFNQTQTVLAAYLVTLLQVIHFVSGDPILLPHSLQLSEVAKQIQFLSQNPVQNLVFKLFDFAQFTNYQSDLGLQVYKQCVKNAAVLNPFPVIESQISLQIVEPVQKAGQLQLDLQDVSTKYNKLLQQYNQMCKIQGGGVVGVMEDQELKKEKSNLEVKVVALEAKIESLERLNQQMGDDKKQVQNQLEISNKTNMVMQDQLTQQQLRMEELQNKKIQSENELKEMHKQFDELKTHNQAVGENYRALKTAVAQVKGIIIGIEMK
ncbi:Conserved_hypothetical protein [Hexamita inflata]|uniref:Uncharacterized protein n=1 Tax=Hexamita inflata TaxID=28002 RepID=A0AA86NE37_9EUKA|nr:Conserved hypothetical protein [Hexamita inflata]